MKPSLIIEIALVALAIVFILAIAFGLVGCTTAPPQGVYCASCVGPYDLTLSSHRTAVLGRP